MKRELVLLRTFSLAMAGGMILLASVAFKNNGNHHFEEIDVQRINIVEPDGTVKMVITNVDKFPNGDTKINDRPTNADRKKRSGMLFFNEDGIECGGFIYDGALTENGHSSGLSLTFDQYDGDQVMQLLTTDSKSGDKRRVSSNLVFMDRPAKESQQKTKEIMEELQALRKTDPAAARAKMQEYQEQELIGGAPRVMLGKSGSQNNGLFLFDDQGMPRAMFYVDQANQAKLDFFNEKGEVLYSFPPAAETN
ncbi:hypothetical protein [Belliella aquatica]|uniref:Uncharacterized protein n=1 Tax=Belliella aquatica TaxID=1323734 RepID=A0ABQ1LRU0_9BACT|nr:hypothetical protein [Belliella aquatica]MCH7404260.1 hypothetical protein [Belliella aquatica]GGC26622.1 hypothetical protein GCM10010993_02080 [Belliella aquatica]